MSSSVTRVIGLDPSLSSFGVSDGSRHEAIRTPPGAILERTDEIRRQLEAFVDAFQFSGSRELFVIEGPSYGSQATGGFLWDAGYLMCRVELWARSRRADLVVVPPATLRKFVTGKGNTPKAEMPLRVFKKWGLEFDADPGCDKLMAYCLHRFGLAMLAGELVHEPPKPRGQGRDATQATRRAQATRRTPSS
jgi:crossover junction endodeoxyribonuclease RuvC